MPRRWGSAVGLLAEVLNLFGKIGWTWNVDHKFFLGLMCWDNSERKEIYGTPLVRYAEVSDGGSI